MAGGPSFGYDRGVVAEFCGGDTGEPDVMPPKRGMTRDEAQGKYNAAVSAHVTGEEHTPEYYDRDRNRASTAGHDTTAELAAYLERRGALPVGASVNGVELFAPDGKPYNGLPEDSAGRKEYPLAEGLLDYAPDALAEIARGSWVGNQKHNPGEPLHHARGKSMDHANCVARHLKDRGKFDKIVTQDGRVFYVRHSVWTAWRAIMLLQEELETAGAPLARGARKAGEK